MPTGEKASGSQDNPESTHESKGKPCRPSNAQGPPPVKQDKNTKRENPKHDTEKDDNRTKAH